MTTRRLNPKKITLSCCKIVFLLFKHPTDVFKRFISFFAIRKKLGSFPIFRKFRNAFLEMSFFNRDQNDCKNPTKATAERAESKNAKTVA